MVFLEKIGKIGIRLRIDTSHTQTRGHATDTGRFTCRDVKPAFFDTTGVVAKLIRWFDNV